MASEPSKQTAAKAVGLQPGTKIGKYEVISRLAIGGQAIIYKCRDPVLGRDVAIKQISTHLAEDTGFLERFRAEAQVLARLGSEQPEVVIVHDLVEDAQGLFIVMEYVSGTSLETTLRDNPGSVELKATLQILWRLCAALHSVHAAGIIHRDIKPSNIIITEGLRPKITDFGVAATSSSQASMVLGTTKYMAPELFGGGPVSGRADMYSLGFVAYEMLIGREKFNEIFADIVRDRHAESLRWMKWHSNNQVVAPPLHEINPIVPASLSSIVARMTAKDPGDRFESMESLGRAIKRSFSARVRGGGVVSVAAPFGGEAEIDDDQAGELVVPMEGPEENITAPIPRRKLSTRAKVILGAAALAILVGGLLATLIVVRRRAIQAREGAETAYKDARGVFDEARDYDNAMKAFVALRKGFPESIHADQASVFIYLCRAHLALQDRHWSRCRSEESSALKRVLEIGRQTGNLEMRAWAHNMKKAIEEFSEYRLMVRELVDVMDQSKKILDDGDADAALALLADKFPDESELPVAQQEELAVFKRGIRRRRYLNICNGLKTTARARVLEGKLVEAQSRYERARIKLESTSAEILPPKQREEMLREVREAQKALKSRLNIQRVTQAVKDARDSGDRERELDALRVAVKVQSKPEWVRRIRVLQEEADFAEIQRLLAKGTSQEAMTRLKKFIARYPSNTKAPVILKGLYAARRFREVKNVAMALCRMRKWDQALPELEKANALQRDDEVEEAIRECRYRIQMTKLRRLIQEKRYQQAEEAGEKARGIRPEKWESEIRPIVEAMRARAKVANALKAARIALDAKQYSKARRIIEPIRAMPEAAALLSRIRYRENVGKGKAALAEGDARTALGLFKIAKRYAKSFEEIKEVGLLISGAEQGLKAREE